MTSFRSSLAPRLSAAATKGKQGKVLRVFPETNRVLVEGINRVTKHTKVGQSQRGTKTGGIEVVEAPIHISNVALVDPVHQEAHPRWLPHSRPLRDGVKREVRVRVAKSSGKDI